MKKPNLQEKYAKEVIPAYKKKFGVKNDLEVPRISRITVNIGIGSETEKETQKKIAEELAKGDCTGSTCVFYLVQAAWGYLLNKYGTEEAKKEIFPKTCAGDWFLGIATTESGAGSDVVG